MLTGMGEKAVKRKGITPFFVGGKANTAQQRAIIAFAVEKGDLDTAQINKVQRSASHDEQAVIGVVFGTCPQSRLGCCKRRMRAARCGRGCGKARTGAPAPFLFESVLR